MTRWTAAAERIADEIFDTSQLPQPQPVQAVHAERSPGTAASGNRLTTTSISDIEMRSIEWLERPLWQRSAFQLLAAPKGAGKGTYLAGLAARLTCRGDRCVFIASEDSASIDLKPRLVAAGADVTLCELIQEHVRLPDDLHELRALLEPLDRLALLVIDPVANHIGARNSNSDAEVREAIAPLNALADNLGCLVIGVRHPGKNRNQGAVASVLGSTAWVDTPRAVVMIARDDADENLRHIQVVAGNRTGTGAARAFRIEAVAVHGLDEPITQAIDVGESSKNVDELLGLRRGERTKTSAARDLLLNILEEEGEKESDALDALVAERTGLATRTIRDVRMQLRSEGLVKSKPDKDAFGEIVRWKVYRTSEPRT